MNRGTEKLLADVLAERAPTDFRAALLAETLRAARRRRHARQTRNGAGILCALILLTVLFRQNFSSRTISAPSAAKKNTVPGYELVRTESLPDNSIVSTKSLPEVQMVSSSATVTEIATTRGNYRRINDDELLALVAARPAILIRTGPDSEELIFANAADRKNLFGDEMTR